MFYALKSDCYFRKYGNIGYIVRPIVSIEEVIDENGAIFIEQLGYEPKSIEEIVLKLCNIFDIENMSAFKNDIEEFYTNLENDGFLISCEAIEDFESKGFDYSTLEGKLAYKKIKSQSEEASVNFLNKHFKNTPFIETFHIELTSKCNERCVHCYIPHENKDTDIEYDLMMNVLEQCKEMNVLTIVFSGGEPMLHPNFCTFLKRAKDLDFNVTVLSNLTVIDDKITEALLYRHASCVNVSLYSMDAAIHDKITTIPGSYERTKNNILKLIDMNIPVQINCPVMKQNKDSFHEVVRWGQEHKCSVLTDYLIMARSDRTTDNLINRLSKEDLEEVMRKLVQNDVVLQSKIASSLMNSSPIDDEGDDEKVCGVGMSTLCMVANGNIYPCAGWQKYVCGNIKEKSLKDIWDNSPQVNYLRGLRMRDFKKCSKCEDKEYCLMCMSRNSNEDSDGNLFNIPQITCEASHLYHKIIEEIREANFVLS